MAFCRSCGNKVEEASLYCSSCGAAQTQPKQGSLQSNPSIPALPPVRDKYGFPISDSDDSVSQAARSNSPARSHAAKKPSGIKAAWFWFLVLLATLILVFGFVPALLSGEAKLAQWLVAVFWVVVIHYALRKLFPSKT